jgi:glycosyltransferase involved in cell wall biosynthesis
MQLFISGYPGEVGGAHTELWHTVKLWRRLGIGVTLIPTWKADAGWKGRLDAIGCRTRESNPDDLENVPGLAGAIVVSMCNSRFLAVAERFRELGCKIVWLGSMNWLFPQERRHYSRHGLFDRYVFQSRYQHDELAPQLAKYGYDDSRGRIIRGAFDVEEFPLRPLRHSPGETFVIGRLSRAVADKFSPRTWEVYRRTPPPVSARVMGWNASVEARLGRPPRWAECLPEGAETAQAFLARLHCLVQMGGTAVENWPRVGLEAMAAGVPVVTDNKGGWTEMIEHGATGFLCDDERDFARGVADLAGDEALRMKDAASARAAVERLADPGALGGQWRELFNSLKAN